LARLNWRHFLWPFSSVPLEPRAPRFDGVQSESVRLSWSPPDNAANLGRDLLGYRIYLTEACGPSRAAGGGGGDCGRKVAPVTVNSARQLSVVVKGLGEKKAFPLTALPTYSLKMPIIRDIICPNQFIK